MQFISKKELSNRFGSILEKVEAVAQGYQKPIVFTEIGFRPVEGTWKDPHAEANGRAILRIDGIRYERQLVRVDSGPELDGIAEVISGKYPSATNRETIESGQVWMFEAAPRSQAR